MKKVILLLFFVFQSLGLDFVWADPASPTSSNIQSIEKRMIRDSDLKFRFGLGYTLFGNYSKNGEIGSLSTILDFDSTHSIQILFGIGSFRENFNFGSGLIYRGTVSGDRHLGLHLGALANLGISGNSDFTAQLGPILGIHFDLFQIPELQMSIDGGPMVRYQQGPDFRLSPFGNGIFGLSFHYFF